MSQKSWAAGNLAAKLLAAPWTRPNITAALDSLTPLKRHDRAALIAALTPLGRDYPPSHDHLKHFLLTSPVFTPIKTRLVPAILDPPLFAPAPKFKNLPIPLIATPGDLATWLGIFTPELEWLSDHRRSHASAAKAPLQHYRYALIQKRNGDPRLLESPKPNLKSIQRKILSEILNKIPLHPAAHGFAKQKSCLTNARIHAAENFVITFDLQNFFPTITLPRIHGLFRALGYPHPVARHLAGLCTTITPKTILQSLPTQTHARHATPHLPQGAPTSPALANLLAYKLDHRLQKLSLSANANYTRYADDLAFSGPESFRKSIKSFAKTVTTIITEEGFTLNPSKTSQMPAHQSQKITGITINRHCNIPRNDYDALKATLHNCLRTGPAAQTHNNHSDFRRHLEGRIAWMAQINPQKAAKLLRLFDQIDFTS
jgi:retron-type reverse transcriptase